MAAPPAPAPVPSAALPAPGVATPPLSSLEPCRRGPGRTTLYIQIYDEALRPAATALRQALQTGSYAPVVVAPVENVIRSADLRQQRRPVPWPKPTFVLHDPAGHDCARAISRYIGAPWVLPGEAEPVWLRDLPRSLAARPGVIELWLPPVEVAVQQNALQAAPPGGRPNGAR